MACAIRLAEIADKNIIVIEAAPRLCRKLAATGNGQGNVSNEHLAEGYYFGGGKSAAGRIACKDPYAATGLFGFMFSADEKGRIYPAGRQASALGDALIRRAAKLGVKVINARAERLERGFIITLSNGEKVKSRCVALCVGGKAQKQFLTDGSSYSLALSLGHRLTPLYPSLVQLKTDTSYIRTLKGIRVDCDATAIVDGKAVKTVRGDVIFTDYGVSGNAIFSLSPYLAGVENGAVSLSFLPDFPSEEIERNIRSRIADGVPTRELLSGSLHNTLGRAVIERCGSAEPARIVKTLKNFSLPVKGALGFDYAQVTRGGVDMRDITDDLESAIVKNLYFAGEVLDVDGECGGYNLQWAFTSGMYIAEKIAERLKDD